MKAQCRNTEWEHGEPRVSCSMWGRFETKHRDTPVSSPLPALKRRKSILSLKIGLSMNTKAATPRAAFVVSASILSAHQLRGSPAIAHFRVHPQTLLCSFSGFLAVVEREAHELLWQGVLLRVCGLLTRSLSATRLSSKGRLTALRPCLATGLPFRVQSCLKDQSQLALAV